MITKSDSHKMLEHRFGGNGWAVLEWLPDNMVRLASVHEGFDNGQVHQPPSIGGQFMLAWVNMLVPQRGQVLRDPNDPEGGYIDGEIVMSEELQQKLETIRVALANGTTKVVNTRLEPPLTEKPNAKIKRSTRSTVSA